MKLADAIVSCLGALQLKYLFGVSGANIEHLHDSVYRLGGSKLQTVMTKSEFGAAFMADARARTHHTLGLCCATSGGGMMNLAVGVAESLAHSVPVLAFVGQPPLQQEGRGSFQDSSGMGSTVNAKAMWQAMTKFTCKIDNQDQFWDLFYQALTLPMQGRKGPAVMLLPRDVMDWDVGDMPEHFLEKVKAAWQPDYLNLGYEDCLAQLWYSLKQSRKPILVLGSGVVREGVVDHVLELVERTGIPVVSTLSCPGVFPNGHPNYLGMIGVAGHPSAHAYIEHEADLIISVGSQLRAMTRATLEAALFEKTLWVINEDLSELDQQLDPEYSLPITIRSWVNRFLDYQNNEPLYFTIDKQAPITCFKPELHQELHQENEGSPEAVFTQSESLKILNHYLPQSGHIFFDAGNCAAAAAHFLKMPLDVSNTIALGMGGMGYAIAGAIGAQLGERKQKRTMVFCGDGAFMMTGLEIHTAVDLQLPILWVVFNNNMHGMCVTRQQLFFEGRIEGNTYSDISVATIASGFGDETRIWARTVSSAEQLTAALDEYLTHHGTKPGVLELKISTEELPPFTPFLPKDAATETAWRVME